MMALTQSRGQQIAALVVLALAIASYMFVSPTQFLVCMKDAVATPQSPPMQSGPASPISGNWSPGEKSGEEGSEPITASIPELAKEYSAALKKSCPQVAGDGQLCQNFAFLYRNSHIPASLSPASFATATVLVRRKGEMKYVMVFLSSEGKVLFEGLEDHFEDSAWKGVGKKVAQLVDGALGGYQSVR